MLRGFISLYSPNFARVVLNRWYSYDRHASKYLGWFWSSKDYTALSDTNQRVPAYSFVVLNLGILLQLILAAVLIYRGLFQSMPAGVSFGLATFVIYPVLWAHLLVVPHAIIATIQDLLNPKAVGRVLVCRMLEKQVIALRKRHEFTVVAVAGSVGKTSTKLAIAGLLSESLRVRYQVGNYNDRVTVPLIFFDQPLPNLLNVFAWLKIFADNRRQIRAAFPYDVVVVELGTDGPGQLQHFSYIQPDLSVITAVDDEHMEYFKTRDAVAQEELSVVAFSKQSLINVDHVDQTYLADMSYISYGANRDADYRLVSRQPQGVEGAKLQLQLKGGTVIDATTHLLGKQGSLIALAATATAHVLGVKKKSLIKGLSQLESFAGRMRVLQGVDQSILIDDSYNASPVAVKAGLDVLYAQPAKQRIAILGNMNELGESSEAAHREVGEYCEPNRLDWVVTIGPDANRVLAPAATKNGCNVRTFDSPYAAGLFVKDALKPDTIVLVEGSQNKVFAEEATKQLLANPKDTDKLVRQSNYWMRIKRQQFSDAE